MPDFSRDQIMSFRKEAAIAPGNGTFSGFFEIENKADEESLVHRIQSYLDLIGIGEHKFVICSYRVHTTIKDKINVPLVIDKDLLYDEYIICSNVGLYKSIVKWKF